MMNFWFILIGPLCIGNIWEKVAWDYEFMFRFLVSVDKYTGKSLWEALLFAEHGENMMCTKIVLNVWNNFCTQHVLPRFELGIFMYWICNSMNNLLSYCGLVDEKIRASSIYLRLLINLLLGVNKSNLIRSERQKSFRIFLRFFIKGRSKHVHKTRKRSQKRLNKCHFRGL